MVCLLCAVWTHVITVKLMICVCLVQSELTWLLLMVCLLSMVCACCSQSEHKQLLLTVCVCCMQIERTQLLLMNACSYCWWSMLSAIWTQLLLLNTNSYSWWSMLSTIWTHAFTVAENMQLLLLVYVCLLYAVGTQAVTVDGLCLLYAIWTHAITFAEHLQFVVVYFWWKQSEPWHMQLLFRMVYVCWM